METINITDIHPTEVLYPTTLSLEEFEQSINEQKKI